MSAYLSPLGNEVQTDANGAPLVGGQIWTYAAGTSTPATTYTGEDAGTPQANPVVLNASGLPDSPIWLEGGTAYKLIVKDAGDVTLRTVDNLTGVNDPATDGAPSEWVVFTGSPTYISATSFSVEGDQTGAFQVSRRLRSTNTGGTVYSTISASAYDAGSGLTTVTVANDSGTLDAGLSTVAYGLLSVTNPSIPRATAAQAADGTSNAVIVTPATLRSGLNASGTAPIYACRAWVNFNGTGTVAIRASGNVSSITDNGTGDYTVNFTTAMSDANYAAVVSVIPTATNSDVAQINATATGSVRLYGRRADTGAAVDVSMFSVAVFR